MGARCLARQRTSRERFVRSQKITRRENVGQIPKVLRVVTRLNIGGPSLHVVLLLRELKDYGYSTELVAGACEPSDGDMSYLLNCEDCVHWIPYLSRSVSPWKNFCALIRLWRLMRRERPDIVHTHTAMAGCLGRLAALAAGVPIVVHTFHGNSLHGYFSPWLERTFLQIERFLAKHTDAICVVCDQQLAELSDRFHVAPRGRFRVMPLGLDLKPFLALPMPVVNGGKLRVGWFGRLVPIKNIELLLRIIEATIEKTDAIEFHVAGDGPDRELVRAASERVGSQLVWHGWKEDITPLVQKCDLLIQTSHNEGTPVALIQGMAAARPFLSTAVGGVVDMVDGPALRTGNGCSWHSNGILAEPRGDAFADALIELQHRREMIAAMGEKARQFASIKYSKETLIASIDALYRELCRSKLLRDATRERVPVCFGK